MTVVQASVPRGGSARKLQLKRFIIQRILDLVGIRVVQIVIDPDIARGAAVASLAKYVSQYMARVLEGRFNFGSE
jgi:hypothetical protein